MSEEPFSYGYYEGTTGDLLLVSMERCARCYCGRGLATCVIITVTVFNCGRGLACCFQITLEEVLLVVLLIVILLLWQRSSHMCYCYYHCVPVAEVSRHILNRVTPLPTSVTPLQHHLLHPASLYITLYHFTSLHIQHHLLHHNQPRHRLSVIVIAWIGFSCL